MPSGCLRLQDDGNTYSKSVRTVRYCETDTKGRIAKRSTEWSCLDHNFESIAEIPVIRYTLELIGRTNKDSKKATPR